MLSIKDYNSKEVDGKIKLSNRFIRAFRPKLFENGGFPTTVQKEEELVKYIDSMHAYSFESHYNGLCGGINELVNENLNIDSKCIHIPYWKLWEMRETTINIDLTVSNHALLEMSPNSLRFYLNFCKNAMKNSKDGLFVFQYGGWRIDQTLIDLIELFDEYGFYLKYFDHSKEIAGFSLKEGSVKKEVLLALKDLLVT